LKKEFTFTSYHSFINGYIKKSGCFLLDESEKIYKLEWSLKFIKSFNLFRIKCIIDSKKRLSEVNILALLVRERENKTALITSLNFKPNQ